MLRWIIAVITGYVAFAVAEGLFYQFTGQNPGATPTLVFGAAGVLYGVVAAAMSGYIAARFAPRGQLIASASVGGIIAAVVVVSWILQGPQSSLWSQLSLLLLIAPSTTLGGLAEKKAKSAA
jgi:hypothetical protein